LAERAKVAVLISGSGTNMAALLYASRTAGCPFEIVLVASNNPDAGGLKLAEAEGVATFVLPHKGMDRAAHDAAVDAAIRQSGAQYVALAGYMRVLTAEFVAGWEGRMVNIHPSLLPSYKGLHTHQRALEAGDKQAGCTVHLVTAELDDGPILGQIAVAVLPGDTATPAASPNWSVAAPRPRGLPSKSAPAPWPCPRPRKASATAWPASGSSRARSSPGSPTTTTATANARCWSRSADPTNRPN
jgi:formyltetrahydrofolate-dependent phosphoribosylglycinamide formyltransferase